jgi:hypothetical protein
MASPDKVIYVRAECLETSSSASQAGQVDFSAILGCEVIALVMAEEPR